jgi:ADP-ribosylglycohydrolase/sugar/nucleoside kinase (ribokinase family)
VTTLVAGCAAQYDLIGRVEGRADPASVAELVDGPAIEGRWVPGGAGPTVALAMAARGSDVALWYPISANALDESRRRLADAGIGLTDVPVRRGAARCIVIRHGQEMLAWSSTPPEFQSPVSPQVLAGINHLVICPRWGPWAESLVAAAAELRVPCSVVGCIPTRAGARSWRVLVVSEHQLARNDASQVAAEVLVITRGAAGCEIRVGSDWLEIPASAADVVDPTGAGDVFGGTFIAELERGASIRAAASTAANAAARCCEVWGAQTALVLGQSGASVQADRVRGALWGLACGDALGMPASFLPRAIVDELWPVGLENMEPAPSVSPYHAGYPAARITDDTEQALALTRAIVASSNRLDPEDVARELDDWLESVGGLESLAVGPSTRRGLAAWRAGTPAAESGRSGATNGAAMRIAPVGVIHGLLASPLDTILDDVAAACMTTHGTSVAISGAAAVAGAVAAGVSGTTWAGVLRAGASLARAGRGRGSWTCAPDVADRIELAIELATSASDHAEARDRMASLVGTGEPTPEAVPATFGIAARAEGDPKLAILLAANTEGDTDTIGAMAGAICGAWAGQAALPVGWRDQVSEVNGLSVEQWAGDLEDAAKARSSLRS